jgi:Carboxypeptidase regulatory-like domain
MARVLCFMVLLLSIAATVLTAPAQTASGVISGTVTDPTGAVLPGATVTARNVDTDDIFTVVTDEAGRFSFSRLAVGTYTVKVYTRSFASATVQGVVVNVGQSAPLSIAVKKGQSASRPTGDGMTHPSDTWTGGATGRDFLVKGSSEVAGYGLYSYILFADPPTDESRPRYLAVIRACRHEMPKIAGLESAGTPKNKLNVAYIPISSKPANADADENWVLDNYDYERAVVLLAYLPKKYQKHQGPYLVSHATPLAADSAGDFLYQDLSIVNEKLATAWIQHFLDRASQEQFWETNKVDDYALALRNFVADTAPEIENIKSAAASWIQTFSK